MNTGKKKKSTLIRAIRRGIETAVLRAVLAVLSRIPVRFHGSLATFVGFLGWSAFRYRRGLVEKNLEIALGETERGRLGRLSRGVYVQSTLFFFELARLRVAGEDEIRRAVDYGEAAKALHEALREGGQGYLIASAHIGNWEWLGAWFSLTFGGLGVIYKPMHNPGSEQVISGLRRRFGTRIFSTRERIPRPLFAHLRQGGVVAVLADQDARKEGVFLPFFGRPAATSTGLASLAVRFNLPILPGFCLRTGPGRFRVVVYPSLRPDPAADRESEEIRLMREYHRVVEEVVRQAPEQYFWWHRRWKTRPSASEPGRREEGD